VVGVAKALGDAYPDPEDKSGKQFVVDVAFKDFPLVRIARLSVMPGRGSRMK
jgi:hypothetical protein